MQTISELVIRILLTACLAGLLIGTASAVSDLDGDGISDDVDNETIVTASATLPAGSYAFQQLVVTNNAVLTLASDTSLPGFKGVAITAGSLRVDAGSTVSADDTGYPAQAGPGYGGEQYLGAGHGGRGGGDGTLFGGPSYGSALRPTEPGSGSFHRPGGGVISLNVTGTLIADGRISASATQDGGYGGGSSGGSVLITAGRFAGTGTIAADGGGEYYQGAGGAGGRIAVYSSDLAFTGTLRAKGGAGSYSTGEDGTVVSNMNPAPVTTVPGGAGLPTDTNADGKYDDVNGNGRADFADVVLYFNQMTWIADHEPVALFDYNGNGRIDFADVVWLFNNL